MEQLSESETGGLRGSTAASPDTEQYCDSNENDINPFENMLGITVTDDLVRNSNGMTRKN